MMKSKDPNHAMHKSACVMMTSKSGKSLSDVDLKLERCSYKMQKAVHPGNGPIPWPEDHEIRKLSRKLD